MTFDEPNPHDDQSPDAGGSTSTLLALTRKLRRTLLENQQEYHRELRALQQKLEESKPNAPSSVDSDELKKIELRLSGANKVAAASKARAEKLEAQLREAQEARGILTTQIADLEKRLATEAEAQNALRSEQAQLQLALDNCRGELVSVQESLQQTSRQLVLSQAELSRLHSATESAHQLSDQSATDAQEALESVLLENEQLNDSLAALTQRIEDSQRAHIEALQEKDDQLQDREDLNATYEENIEAALRENETLRGQLANLESDKMKLSELKERIAQDFAEVRKKGSARLRELEQKCKELEGERNTVAANLTKFQSELQNSAKMREILESRASAAERLDAENKRLQQKLVAQYSAIESADQEAQKAKDEAFENRKKLLEFYNRSESVELVETGRKKAERRAEEKASEATALKAQLAESQKKYQELQAQIDELQSQPSGSSLSKFLGRISGPLRPLSADDEG